jgi:transposase
MFTPTMALRLTATEREDVERLVRATSAPAGPARRARCILLLADGCSYAAVCAMLGVTDRFVAQWKRRYLEAGVLALVDAPRAGRQDHRVSPATEAKILRLTEQARPRAPLTHWTSRRLARQVGVSSSTVLRVWQRAGLKPHRLRRYLTSPDPDFETKAADILGLYLNPPEHAAVFCLDEKTAIQALDRTDPVLPLSPGRAERHGFEYYRHGTLALYAALEVGTGRIDGMPSARHTSREFVRFLERLVAPLPRRQEIHVILDNFRAHKTLAVREWLAAHPTVHFHFTPTYSCWLNQIELWFGRIEREMLARGIFTSVADLRHKLLQYIRLYNTTCKPIAWSYNDPSRRIRAIRNSDAVH